MIGNAAYQKGADCRHSLADGGLVAEALTSVGFEIVEGADVNASDLRRLFGEFLDKVNAAGPDTIALVYYNGYAVQFEGENYLIPVDAQLNRESEISLQGIRLFDLLRPLADTPAATKIVVLDAARPLPFQIPGGQLAPGLGAIESHTRAAGRLLVRTRHGVAQDGPGPLWRLRHRHRRDGARARASTSTLRCSRAFAFAPTRRRNLACRRPGTFPASCSKSR